MNRETLNIFEPQTNVETQMADTKTFDTKAIKVPTKTSTLMGEKVDKEIVGLVTAKDVEAVDVACEVRQPDASNRIALKNAKIAGVNNFIRPGLYTT